MLDSFIKYEIDAVILANGEYPTNFTQLSILRQSKYLICCDGAINSLTENDPSVIPDVIVGDCDSLSLENKIRFSNIIHQITDQSINDLTKSVQYAINIGKKNIVILGATGKREDHTVANISLLADYAHQTDNISMVTDYGIFNPQKKGERSYASFKGQQVSFFCVRPCKISVTNMVYQCHELDVDNWWQASLNQSTSESFTVKSSGDILIYRVL